MEKTFADSPKKNRLVFRRLSPRSHSAFHAFPGEARRRLVGVCQQSQKIHAAILAYCADHDGYFPPADKWVGLIAPYVDDLKIFTCPAAPPTPGLSWVKVGGVAYPGHYGINQLLHNQDVADKGWCR